MRGGIRFTAVLLLTLTFRTLPQPLFIGEESRFKFLNQPVWVLAESKSDDSRKSKLTGLWKPVLFTIAAGGTTYLIYSLRSK